MNLAEIRRKAQAAEAPAPEAPVAPAFPQSPAPAQRHATEAPAPQAPAAVQEAPAAPEAARSWQEPAPAWEEPDRAWDEPARAWQEPQPAPAWEALEPYRALPQWEAPSGFDPATVILRGRETATSDEEVREVEEAEASLELLCFRVANEDYAISIMDIKEIIKPREVTEVPRVPAFVRGILSLRGIIIPVFDMRLRLGLPAGERSERERVIVVKRKGGFCGVLVDQVVQVVRIAQGGVEAPPVVLEGIDREFVQGIGRVAGKMLILLDMEKVLDVSLL